MGRRGIGAQKVKKRRKFAGSPHPWEVPGLTRSERVAAFVESLPITQGTLAGTTMRLRPWQRRFIDQVYTEDGEIRTAALSMARKNGKTALASALCLCALCGPESERRGECYAVASTRFQAGRVFNEMCAVISETEWMRKRLNIVKFRKEIEDDRTGSTFTVLAADVGPVHGLSPSFVCYDELAQVPSRALYDALQTALGARESPLILVISTQASSDTAPMSELVDYSERIARGEIQDPHFHMTFFGAPKELDPWDPETWKLANPALGDFRSLKDVERLAKQAQRMPSAESSFRQYILNQRVATANNFISTEVWKACATPIDLEGLKHVPIYAGLDLSEAADLTAFVMMGFVEGRWHVLPTCWLPREGLLEKAIRDRTPYDQWVRDGHLLTTPGKAIAYEHIAEWLFSVFAIFDIKKIGFDAWRFNSLKPWLIKAGFTEQMIADHFVPVRQGYVTMAPALRDLEVALLEDKIAHAGHPVLNMCAANSVVTMDAAGNKKLDKKSSVSRIDAMVALVDAFAVVPEPPTREICIETLIG
jgi:phage terminase large subunit-like protein